MPNALGPEQQPNRALSHWVPPAVVIALAMLSPLPVLAGQFSGTSLDPLSAPISQYVHLPGGYPMVLLGAWLLAGCGAVIAVDLLRDADSRPQQFAAVLLASFAVALIVVGVVPTDPAGSTVVSSRELVHRFAVGWAFFSLPLAGLVLARAPRLLGAVSGAALTRLAVALLGGVLLFGSVQLPLLAVGADGIPALGLVERIAFGFMIGYLILLAVVLRSPARVAVPVP